MTVCEGEINAAGFDSMVGLDFQSHTKSELSTLAWALKLSKCHLLLSQSLTPTFKYEGTLAL